jgi:hypothetical protein
METEIEELGCCCSFFYFFSEANLSGRASLSIKRRDAEQHLCR